ncbi:hypothetical protein [Rhizobium sp. 2MFCol3.1]|uniref:hypothetical protein n=1 Tax=Rhizobium sp. 2MFCol3.1 TaxID=1246459 RepID=UPI0012DD39F2|nr:hypothetical protein [Rhizobium sp. 2MFCol3.1]
MAREGFIDGTEAMLADLDQIDRENAGELTVVLRHDIARLLRRGTPENVVAELLVIDVNLVREVARDQNTHQSDASIRM